ncbi:MAG: hypothetical protein AAGB14_15905 [Verrucomicrobiota bacterium]
MSSVFDHQKLIEALADEAASALAEKLSEGVRWTDPGTGQVYLLETDSASQALYSASAQNARSGYRPCGAAFRIVEIVDDRRRVTFRPTSNSELILWADLVDEHIRRCHRAESIVVRKLHESIFLTDFEMEFQSLQE